MAVTSELVSTLNARELAEKLGRAIDRYNRSEPEGKRIKIDTTLSRILDNDPERPRTSRAKRSRPTKDPGIFAIKRYADQAGVTVSWLLGEDSKGLSPAASRVAATLESLGLTERIALAELLALMLDAVKEPGQDDTAVTSPQRTDAKIDGTTRRRPSYTSPRPNPSITKPADRIGYDPKAQLTAEHAEDAGTNDHGRGPTATKTKQRRTGGR